MTDGTVSAQDLYSYKREQSRGLDDINLVTILMRDKGFSLQESVDYVGAQISSLLDLFNNSEAALPSFGPKVDRDWKNTSSQQNSRLLGILFGASTLTATLDRKTAMSNTLSWCN